MAPSAAMQYRQEIDGLRAVAVLAVVIFHAYPQALPGGFVGVDVFFVISGYLITGLLLKEPHDFLGFYARRARRIFPALILVLSACLAFGWARLLPQDFASLGWNAAAGAGFVSNILSAQTDYFHPKDSPLLHLWSLAIEEQFYLVWPAVMLLRSRRLVVAALVASFLYGCYLPVENPTAGYFSSLGRWWQLMAGALLAMSGRLPSWLAYIGAGMVAASFVAVDSQALYPHTQALLPTIGAALLIGAKDNHVFRVLSMRPVVAVGLISYPLYLWHWPLLVWFRDWTSLAVVASFIAAAATYLFVEKPIRRMKLSVSIPAALALVCVGCFGIAAASEGFPNRLPPQVLAAVKVDTTPASWRLGSCLLERPTAEPFKGCDGRIVVLGDSHAAVLRHGLSKHLEVGQYAQASCGPWDSPKCSTLYRAAMSEIAKTKPHTVVLHANWGHYKDRQKLAGTIEELRLIVPRVVVVGSVPTWPERVNVMVGKQWQKSGTILDDYLANDTNIDDEMRVISAGAEFVSAREPLCRQGKCLAMLDGAPAYTDSNHLTDAGSELLAGVIWRAIDGSALVSRSSQGTP